MSVSKRARGDICPGTRAWVFAVLLLTRAAPPLRAQLAGTPAVAWGDRGNGTVANPVLPADFSDIDAICVGIATRSLKA